MKKARHSTAHLQGKKPQIRATARSSQNREAKAQAFFNGAFTELSYRRDITNEDLKMCVILLANLNDEQRHLVHQCAARLRDRHRRVSKTLVR